MTIEKLKQAASGKKIIYFSFSKDELRLIKLSLGIVKDPLVEKLNDMLNIKNPSLEQLRFIKSLNERIAFINQFCGVKK